ncbi:MAG: HYExAFE family protein [Planctomycetaceae bacterium]|nr:HYExAFE family protein [Planctomycetaceae bacterium]
MTRRDLHYEAAFEDYLRSKGWPYVAVDQAKKAIFTEAAVKSFDFLVYSQSGPNLLVDVKGRKFPDSVPGLKRGHARAWENWITRDDVEGLTEWERVFGQDFHAVLVFAYWLQGPPQRSPFEDVHLFRQRHYAFVAVSLRDYAALARPRSAKWQTLSMPSADLAKSARDMTMFL